MGLEIMSGVRTCSAPSATTSGFMVPRELMISTPTPRRFIVDALLFDHLHERVKFLVPTAKAEEVLVFKPQKDDDRRVLLLLLP